jgi:hypothetical protein
MKGGNISKDICDCPCRLRTKQTSETVSSFGKDSRLKMILCLDIISGVLTSKSAMNWTLDIERNSLLAYVPRVSVDVVLHGKLLISNVTSY